MCYQVFILSCIHGPSLLSAFSNMNKMFGESRKMKHSALHKYLPLWTFAITFPQCQYTKACWLVLGMSFLTLRLQMSHFHHGN